MTATPRQKHPLPSDAQPTAPSPRESHPDSPPETSAVDLTDESAAGEEDPGASIDVSVGDPTPSPTPGEKR